MIEDDLIKEVRPFTQKEIAELVRNFRKDRQWSQEALAANCQLTERTVQRVENGEPSNVQTRRALAKGLELPDLDFFNKPFPFPDVEKVKAEHARIQQEFVTLAVEPVNSSRTLWSALEQAQAYHIEPIDELPDEAEQVLAEMGDLLRDYGLIREDLSATDCLDMRRSLAECIDRMVEYGIKLGVTVRRTKIVGQGWQDKTPMPMTICCVVATAQEMPNQIRVPRQTNFRF